MKSMTMFLALLVLCFLSSHLFVRSEPSIDTYEILQGGEALDVEFEGEVHMEEQQREGESELDSKKQQMEAEEGVKMEQNEDLGMPNEELLMMNQELEMLNEELLMVNEELGMKNEELGMKNEELGMKNEELGMENEELGVKNVVLGMKNEELGMKNKELGMVNEELGMVNEELGMKNEELGIESEKQLRIAVAKITETELKPGYMGVPPELGVYSPVPLPLSGTCAAGTKYTINSMNDLYDNVAELECIFAAGVEPNDIPLGFSYGYLLSAANTAFWDIPAEIGYQGDYVVKTQCHGKEMYIGWLSILGLDLGTAVWSVGTVDFPLAAGEYPMGMKKGIVMDFGVDFDTLCSVEGNELPLRLKGFSPFKNSPWPVSQFIDIGRVVGRDQSDGGIITLNKAYIISDTLGAQTLLLYATKNFDPKIRPDFAKFGEQAVTVPFGPRGETLIKYNKGGLETVLKRLFGSFLSTDDAFTSILSLLPFGVKR